MHFSLAIIRFNWYNSITIKFIDTVLIRTFRKGDIMNVISTDKAPAAIGPYSQAISCGDLLFTSGQIPLNPTTGEVEGTDITAQAHMALKNLTEVVKAAGTTMDKVIKTTCFLADMADFATFNSIYTDYLPGKPARSCVAVKQLPKGVLVEVEAIVSLK